MKKEKKLTGAVFYQGTEETAPEIFWLTGFRAPDPVGLLVYGKENFLIVSALEKGRALKETAAGFLILTPEDITGSRNATVIEAAIFILKEKRETRVRMPPSIPFATAAYFEKAGVLPILLKPNQLLDRSVKTGAELKKIEASQRAACRAMKAAVQWLAQSQTDCGGFLTDGVKKRTSADLKRVINRCLLEDDCFCADVIVACGAATAQPHNRGRGALKVGVPIVLDIFPQHNEHGYWGDLTRTVCKGRVPAALRHMHQAVKKAQQTALNLLRPGISGAVIHRAVEEFFQQEGFKTALNEPQPYGFIHGTGHGVGLEIHEAPRISRKGGILKEGQVVTVEPGLYYPRIGGVRIEDTVRITEDGWAPLVRCPAYFEIS